MDTTEIPVQPSNSPVFPATVQDCVFLMALVLDVHREDPKAIRRVCRNLSTKVPEDARVSFSSISTSKDPNRVIQTLIDTIV